MWQKQMWATLRKNQRDKEIANRPKYISMFEKAKDKHFVGKASDLKIKANFELEAKESLWRKEVEVTDFRDEIKQMLKLPIKQEDFIENLMTI